MLTAIGNTPLVRLSRIVPADAADVWVKLEYFNPTGSYKDRMARSMIERAEQRGDLQPGMTVVEYTGGSTGISLAFVCAVKGYRCRIVTSDALGDELVRQVSGPRTSNVHVPARGKPTVTFDLQAIGTAGFEFNGLYAGPLFYRHVRARNGRIGRHGQTWDGKHYGKHIQRL